MCQAFTDNGHDVVITGIASAKSSLDPMEYYGLRGGFHIERFNLGSLCNNKITRQFLIPGFALAGKTTRVIKEFKPDIIYSRLTITELAFVPSDIPILYEMHSLGPLGGSFIQRNAFKSIVKKKHLKRFVVTTNYLAELLKSEFPDIEVVVARLSAEPPVDISKVALDVFKADHLQGQEFKWHTGYTGYLDTVGLRGTDIIIRAAEQMPDVAFHIVGGSPEVVEYWKKFAENYNQHGNIFFYKHRNPSEIPFFLACFDVALAPLQYRPCKRAPSGQGMSPLKIPQYMGFGKAIVASDIRAHKEILRHEENALLVASDNIFEWVKAINRLLKDESLRRHIQGRAQENYYSEFTPEKRVQRVLGGLGA